MFLFVGWFPESARILSPMSSPPPSAVSPVPLTPHPLFFFQQVTVGQFRAAQRWTGIEQHHFGKSKKQQRITGVLSASSFARAKRSDAQTDDQKMFLINFYEAESRPSERKADSVRMRGVLDKNARVRLRFMNGTIQSLFERCKPLVIHVQIFFCCCVCACTWRQGRRQEDGGRGWGCFCFFDCH